MKKDELKERIKSLISEVTFTYNGERCGVDPFSAHDFDVWYGDKYEKMRKSVLTTGWESAILQ